MRYNDMLFVFWMVLIFVLGIANIEPMTKILFLLLAAIGWTIVLVSADEDEKEQKKSKRGKRK